MSRLGRSGSGVMFARPADFRICYGTDWSTSSGRICFISGSRARRIAALAETYYVAVAPRHEGGPIATAAALHVAASLPNFFIQHIPLAAGEEDRSLRAQLAGADLERVRNGFASLPSGPGLGITVNEAALERFHVAWRISCRRRLASHLRGPARTPTG
jgi:hypothetical protein